MTGKDHAEFHAAFTKAVTPTGKAADQFMADSSACGIRWRACVFRVSMPR